MTPRGRNAARTRSDLLVAAQRQFAREGFDKVTVRSIAAEVGVDQALVLRYFGSKAELFAEAARTDFALPDLTGLGPEEIADALVDRFFTIFDEQSTFLALLRSAATSRTAADQMMGLFLAQAAPVLARAAVDRPAERAALVGSQMLGFAFLRYVLGSPHLGAMDRDQMRAWVGPTVARYLTDPDLGPASDPDAGPV